MLIWSLKGLNLLSFTSVKIITSWIILALTHPKCVYTAQFHLSAGDFDLKITLGFEILKSTVRSPLIHIFTPQGGGSRATLSLSWRNITFKRTRQYAQDPRPLSQHFLCPSYRLLLLEQAPHEHADSPFSSLLSRCVWRFILHLCVGVVHRL